MGTKGTLCAAFLAALALPSGAGAQEVSSAAPKGFSPRSADGEYTDAWQLTASYFLTGQEAAFRGFQPKSRFSPAAPTPGASATTGT